MNKNNRNIQHYINHNKCVSLPQKDDCDYLRISNYLSEYLTYQEKLLVLDNLGITDLINNLAKEITNKFESYVSFPVLDEYVRKEDLYYPDDDDEDGSWSQYAGGEGGSGYGCIVDDFLSLTSINPVQNRIITAALNTKANIDSVVTLTSLLSYLENYLRKLTAGNGIKIDTNTNVISTTLDLNPFVVVDERPEVGVSNKIYLVPDKTSNSENYILYYWKEGTGWITLGNINGIFGKFLTLEEADLRYSLKGETTQVNGEVTKAYLEKYYVKKLDVYTPDQYGINETSDDLQEIEHGGSNTGNNGGSNSGNNSGNNNYVNITIDSDLSIISTNPVLNKVITKAIRTKLDILTAGDGISINNGVISCTFDTSLYKIVDLIPLTGDENKIYLVPQADGSSYKQYIFVNGRLRYIGENNFGTDFSAYLRSEDAENIYLKKSEASSIYLTKSFFDTYRTTTSELLSAYVTKTYVDNLFGSIDTEAINSLIELLELLTREGNILNLLQILLAAKANIVDVYDKSTSDEKFLAKGNYVTSTQLEQALLGITFNPIYEDFLSETSKNPVLNKKITAELKKKLSIADASEIYVTKTNLETTLLSYTRNLKLKTINNKSLFGEGNIDISFTVDSTITENGLNAVSGRGIYLALALKLNTLVEGTGISIVGNVISVISDDSKLDVLIAGTGISINNNVISVIADTNPFIITDQRPNVGIPNKLYLVKNGNTYTLYVYEDNAWINKGTIEFNIDLSQYVKKSELGSYVKTTDLANYLQNTDLTNYALKSELLTLRTWVSETFLEKEQVYTPSTEWGDTLSNSLQEITINSQTGSNNFGIGGSNNSGSSSSVGSGKYESNLADGVLTTISVGNIAAGTNVSLLKGRSISEILDRMFFNEIWTDPNYKHTISMSFGEKIVKVGTPIISPTIVSTWNNNVLPQSNITTSLSIKKPGQAQYSLFTSGDIYDTPGSYMFTLEYSYPTGSYTITSNYGNTREIQVLAKSNSMFDYVQATYPWYINNLEQSTLVPINNSHTQEVTLNGSPSIAIPGALSRCTIQADLGLGYMDVSWNRTEETRNGVIYSVWTKQDSYLQSVRHKITFNIYIS